MAHLNKSVGLYALVLGVCLLASCSNIQKHDVTTSNIINSVSQQGKNIDWPSFGRDYANKRFSENTQINRDNVQNLTTAWIFKSGVKAAFQATPIVVDGIMYVSLPFNHVVALDGKTGKELWRYKHNRRVDWNMCCGPANRGVAVGYGKVFIGTVDARLIALDAKTGEKVWDINAVDVDVSTEGQDSLNKNDPNK